MIIQNSRVDMVSTHTENVVKLVKTAQIDLPEAKAKEISISTDKGNYVEQLKEEANRFYEEQTKMLQENPRSMSGMYSMGQSAQVRLRTYGGRFLESEAEFQKEIMRRFFGALEVRFSGRYRDGVGHQTENGIRQYARRMLDGTAIGGGEMLMQPQAAPTVPVASQGIGTVWTKMRAVEGSYEETEQTTYQADGMVQTADGRQISFRVQVGMSRSVSEKYEEFTRENYILTDPLVINYAGDTAKITDQKFLFDLDGDGEAEEMNFTAAGSGFLALDKNGDGVINDGNELFGTKSGDGFRDLAAYDTDGNGWIDEADRVFADLKIYTKDADGNDVLLSLKDVGVGAIYLGSASTEFSMKESESNDLQAQVRKTGVFLYENGGAGTIQHIDFAV